MTYRSATTGDLAAVLSFWQQAAEDSGRPADSEVALGHLLARDPDALLLGLVDGTLVATVIAGWDGWRCHLYRLAVHPSMRRRGIGSELVARAERRFVAAGGIRVDAMVLDDNGTAHAAWAAAGYTRQPDWSRWVRPLP